MLFSALQIGRSALSAASVGTSVIGNNIANAATPGYSRQVVDMAARADQSWGRYFTGRGVEVNNVRRLVDQALHQRILGSTSQENAAASDLNLLEGVENLVNSLSDSSLNNQFTKFFNSWSQLTSTPGESGARSLVVQQGKALASSLRGLRSSLVETRNQIDRDLATSVTQANDLLKQVASLNTQIVTAEQGQGNGESGANALRDQRDQLLVQLAQYVDITTIPQASGVVDVLVGSTPVVLAGQSRGLELRTTVENGVTTQAIATSVNPEVLNIRSGRVGSLLKNRDSAVDATLADLDTVTSKLIFEVNRLHSQGYGTTRMTSTTAERSVANSDWTKSFNDPTNTTFSMLPFKATSGAFIVRVRNDQTGASQAIKVGIDLDGLGPGLVPGYTSDTSLQSLQTQLSANVPNCTTSITPDGKLKMEAGAGYTISFEDDTSGVLATLGMNTYFTGTNASNVGVRSELDTNPGLLSAGLSVNGSLTDNGTAMALTALRDKSLGEFGGRTLAGFWDNAVQSVAAGSTAARTAADATATVREGLDAQRQAMSGVSIDEEAINLINFQRQYEASARYLSVVNELTQTLLQLV